MQFGMNQHEKVMIGGMEQWILIRGKKIANPILLFLHGGPGFAAIPFANGFDRRIEDNFTVVYWDQRGAGKSYNENISRETMKIEQFQLDAIELIELLKSRFDKEKIYLIGHSWGALLGIYIVSRFPHHFYAYIGVGQVVEYSESRKIAHNYVFDYAKKVNDEKALTELMSIGNPPYLHPEDFGVTYKYIVTYGGAIYNADNFSKLGEVAALSEEYTTKDLNQIDQGVYFSNSNLYDEYIKVNLFKEIQEVKVPMYFCSGKMDYLVPFEVAYQYYNLIKAPSKEFIWFDYSAHFPFLEEPEKFYEVLCSIKQKGG